MCETHICERNRLVYVSAYDSKPDTVDESKALNKLCSARISVRICFLWICISDPNLIQYLIARYWNRENAG
jgi:hypothetical protein